MEGADEAYAKLGRCRSDVLGSSHSTSASGKTEHPFPCSYSQSRFPLTCSGKCEDVLTVERYPYPRGHYKAPGQPRRDSPVRGKSQPVGA